MPFTGIIDPEQLALLTKVLDSHCRAHGIADAETREQVAFRIVSLFGRGARTAEELVAALRLSDERLRANASAAKDALPAQVTTSQSPEGQ
jgi:hypothetical protein